MQFIDTHAHISHFKPEDQKAVIERAREAGVKKMINVACHLDQVERHLALAKTDDNLWTSVGIHPTDLTDDMERDMAAMLKLAREEKKIVAIGEMGLDYYHDKFSHDRQEAFLVAHLEVARQAKKPVIIHCRGGKNPGQNALAFRDLIRILKRERFTNAVVHCFSGDEREAAELVEMGLFLSFTGIVTYKNNVALRKTIKKVVPLDRIMLETDCPYLTIEGKRGQAGEPAFLPEVARVIAEAKGVSVEEVAKITVETTERFFGI